ncbi:hypothetical protein [uncultured Sneathiella sp.]|uniref:hypothetical protein n=1 Tax=uncultured Sneathiella sp. TaxID=879315 RepID=UPI0030EB60DE|tara:strand:- start:9227 stop:10582 length:1356 start_codon:yes stop_codon:yes gene_type:complete
MEYAKSFKEALKGKPGKVTVLHQLFYNVMGVITPRMVAIKDPEYKQGKDEKDADYELRIENYLKGVFGQGRVSKNKGGEGFAIKGCISQHSSIIITVNIGTEKDPKWVQYGYETGTPQDGIGEDGVVRTILNQRKGPRSSTTRIMYKDQPKKPEDLKVVEDPNVAQMQNLYSENVFNKDFRSRGTPSVTFTVDAPYAGNALLNMLSLTGEEFNHMLATTRYEAHGEFPGQRASCTLLLPQVFNDAGVDIRKIFAGYQFRPWDATDDAQYEHYGNIFDGLVAALQVKDETGSVEKFNELTPRAWSKETMQELFGSFTATHLYLRMMEEIESAALASDETDDQLLEDVEKMKEDVYMTPHAMAEYAPITCALYKLFHEHSDFPALQEFDQKSVTSMLLAALENTLKRTELYEKLAKESGADPALLKHLKGRYDLIDELLSKLPPIEAPSKPTK